MFNVLVYSQKLIYFPKLVKTRWSRRPYFHTLFAFKLVIVFGASIWLWTREPFVPDILGNVTSFELSDAERASKYFVPNVIHMLHFGKPDLTFIEVVSLKAAYMNHKPDRIMIHCDCHTLRGKYWDKVKDIDIIEIRFKRQPKHIFGKRVSCIYHASDIARIEIMMKFGGIYIDSDTYVVSSLDQYRNFEFSIGWPEYQNLGNQILIAHKKARFLKLWYQSYMYYIPSRWYYNAGQLPTAHILKRMPSLVNRVTKDFGVHDLRNMLYEERTEKWKTFKTIHLLIRWIRNGSHVLQFDEENIKTYNRTFGDMARLIWYGKTDIIKL